MKIFAVRASLKNPALGSLSKEEILSLPGKDGVKFFEKRAISKYAPEARKQILDEEKKIVQFFHDEIQDVITDIIKRKDDDWEQYTLTYGFTGRSKVSNFNRLWKQYDYLEDFLAVLPVRVIRRLQLNVDEIPGHLSTKKDVDQSPTIVLGTPRSAPIGENGALPAMGEAKTYIIGRSALDGQQTG